MITGMVVASQYLTASALVGDKFERARDMAEAAWSRTLDFLARLQNVSIAPVMPNTGVAMTYTPVAISTNLYGQKPTPPTAAELTLVIPNKPSMGTLQELDMLDYPRAQLEAVRLASLVRIAELLDEGATGLDATVEAAIWDRARGRQDLATQQKYEEVEEYFASRGFELPPGALVGALNEIVVEGLRNDANLNNDIMVEQARLAQSNMHFVIERAAAIVNEIEQTHVNSIISSNKMIVEIYVSELEAYKSSIQAEIMRVEAIIKRYLAQIDAYKADTQVAMADIDVQAKVIQLKIEQARIQADLSIKQAEISIEQARLYHAILSDAIKAGAQVSAQITASALSSVNASASLSSTGSAQTSESDSWSHTEDLTKQVPDVRYIHNFG